MKNLQLWARLHRSLKNRGLLESLRHYTVRVYRIVRPHKLDPHPFDLEHGVHTTAYILGSDLAVGHPHDMYSTTYLASYPSMVTSCIEGWRAFCTPSDPPLEQYTFVDIGAGMGRATMVASQYPFRRVVGVELNTRLTEQARRNLEVWEGRPHSCREVEIANCEVCDFDWPRTPLAIYMFNPFESPVIEAMLRSLERPLAEGAGPIDILYVYPAFTEAFEAHPRARLVARTHSHLSDADRAVNPYDDPTASESRLDFHIYRFERQG